MALSTIFGSFGVKAEEPFKGIIITPDNSAFLLEDVTQPALNAVLHKIKSNEEIKYLVIYSHGGDPDIVSPFTDQISKLVRLQIIIISASSSAASITQLYENQRIIVPNGRMMFHRVQFTVNGTAEYVEWQKHLEEYRLDDELFAQQCMNRMTIPRTLYDEKTIRKDWRLDAKEALNVGAVERIVPVKCNSALRDLHKKVNVYNYDTGSVEADVELCSFLNRFKEIK